MNYLKCEDTLKLFNHYSRLSYQIYGECLRALNFNNPNPYLSFWYIVFLKDICEIYK